MLGETQGIGNVIQLSNRIGVILIVELERQAVDHLHHIDKCHCSPPQQNLQTSTHFLAGASATGATDCAIVIRLCQFQILAEVRIQQTMRFTGSIAKDTETLNHFYNTLFKGVTRPHSGNKKGLRLELILQV